MAADVEAEDLASPSARRPPGSSASFTPPALPRPPVSTCALTTTGPPSSSAARARLLRRRREPPVGDRNAEALEELLALVLVEDPSAARHTSAAASLAVDGCDRRRRAAEALRRGAGARRRLVRRARGRGLRPARPERRRQVDDRPRARDADARRTKARASVAGHDVAREQNAVRRAIGYVPQDSGVDQFGDRPREPDAAGARPGDGRPRRCAQRVDELLELVGIADAADRIVKGYSGGMRRRLDIALGLVHRPRVLFLDEPTTGLDPEARVAMWEEVGAARRGRSR